MNDTQRYKTYAKRIGLFNGLTPDEVSHILHEGRVIQFPKGKTIFHKGQLGKNLFVVFSGRVDIYNEDHVIAKCRVGDVFGVMSALDRRPHTATAVASTDVKLFTLDEDQLNSIIHNHVATRFLMNVIHLLSQHLADTNTMLARLEKKVHGLQARLSDATIQN